MVLFSRRFEACCGGFLLPQRFRSVSIIMQVPDATLARPPSRRAITC
jgi:hypothetical protein